MPNAKFPVELVEAELLDPGCWKDAVSGCSYILHVASPFPPPSERIQDENTLIKPAVEGVKNVLNACAEVGGVKRVVLTSSMAAIAPGNVRRPEPLDESCWADLEKCWAYEKSKNLAEKAAWDFVAGLPEDKIFELSVINPGFVIGPLLVTTQATSGVIIKTFMHKEMPVVPRIGMGMVDVKDVALAHIKAMTLPEAAGKRHILAIPATFIDLTTALDREFKSQGYNIPTRVAPNFLMRIAGCFDDQAKATLPYVGRMWNINNDRMTKMLGIQPSDVQEAAVSMAYSLIERGIVKRTRKYQGRN